MPLKPVALDFLHPTGRAWRGAPWLLLTGAVAAIVALAIEREVAQATKARQAQVEAVRGLARRSLPELRGEASDSPELREQIKKANVVLAQLNVPWGGLFSAVESAQEPNVRLLAVQPDPRSSTVAISGRANSLSALWEYMDRLQQTKRLRDVVLLSHELRADEPGRPVAFVLSARWIAGGT